MFLVTATSPLDDQWEERDKDIRRKAKIQHNVHTVEGDGKKGRQSRHEWVIQEFEDACKLKWRLELVPGAKVTLREYASAMDE